MDREAQGKSFQILVPFSLESPLSGAGRQLEPNQELWYRRDIPEKPKLGRRTLLHFGAVDYDATVFVNGKEVGRHVGGHTPFSFDITGALVESGNVLTVKVIDATEGYQLHGKQSLRPRAIWCNRVSGIWQTVWLEHVPERSIRDLDFETVVTAPEKEGGTANTAIQLKAKLEGVVVPGESLKVKALLEGKEVAAVKGSPAGLSIPIPQPRWWTPDTPTLYDLEVDLADGTGKVIDSVKSYSALRQVGKMRDENGNLQITLNGKPIFLLGTLDQGWWSDGLLTPPSDEAMVSNLKYLKAAGFNMVRKHVKVENSRYYYFPTLSQPWRLDVQSRRKVVRIRDKRIRLILKGRTDELERRETCQRIETFAKIVGIEKRGDVLTQMGIRKVMIGFYRRFFDRAVHAFYLAICPRMPGLGQAMIYAMACAMEFKGMGTENFSFLQSLVDIRSC